MTKIEKKGIIYMRVPVFYLDKFKESLRKAIEETKINAEAYVYDGYMYNVYVVTDNEEKAKRLFDALSEKAWSGEFYYTIYEIRGTMVDTYGKKKIL